MLASSWLSRFPELQLVVDSAGREALREAQVVCMPPQTMVYRMGQACTCYLLVVSGRVRVQQVSSQGREVVLYRLTSGDSCVLTTACLLSQDTYPAEGVTETTVEAVVLPSSSFQSAIHHSEAFRKFVFNAYGKHLLEIMTVMEGIAFTRLNVRLAKCLLDLGSDNARLTITHQALAAELGSAREVVSRLLREFERYGWVHRGKGFLEILNYDALKNMAVSEY
ncbi:MAG: Crp/Fnr family transcriptional regulator [Acidithiobacillus sp.]